VLVLQGSAFVKFRWGGTFNYGFMSTRGNFAIRRTRTCFADRSFTIAGPTAGNALPDHIRNIYSYSTFCRHLKTCLLFQYDLYYVLYAVFYVIVVRRCWAPDEQRPSNSMMMMIIMMMMT